jgi:hypothetical protein
VSRCPEEALSVVDELALGLVFGFDSAVDNEGNAKKDV